MAETADDAPSAEDERDADQIAADERDAAERDAAASKGLWRNLIWLGVLVALAVGLLLAVPGLRGVAHTVSRMTVRWLILGVVLEILSCAGYILAFLQVFERSPIRFGARVALTELAFNSAVSLGGVGSVAVGGLLLVERGGDPTRVAERSAVLFLLTTAINVLTVILVGFLLWLRGVPGNPNTWGGPFPPPF